MNEYDTEYDSKDSTTAENLLNILIHDYLTKKKYTGSAKIFQVEAEVQEYPDSESVPILYEWFTAFNDICMVRSGLSSDQTNLSRIEGVMMRLENEKKRHANIMKGTYYDYRPMPSRSKKREEHRPFLSEVGTHRYHAERVTCMAIGAESKILITGGTDRLVNIINLKTMKREASFEAHSMKITDIRLREADGEVLFVTSSFDKDLGFFKYGGEKDKPVVRSVCVLRGHASSIAAIDFGEAVFSVDIEGELRKWNLNGVCEGVVDMGEGVKSICCVGADLLLVSDHSRMYLYDFAKREVVRELLKECVLSIRRYGPWFLMRLKTAVLIYDDKLQRTNYVALPGDRVFSSCLLNDGSILFGAYENVYLHRVGGVLSVRAHDSAVTCLDTVRVYNKWIVVSCSHGGDCTVWHYWGLE